MNRGWGKEERKIIMRDTYAERKDNGNDASQEHATLSPNHDSSHAINTSNMSSSANMIPQRKQDQSRATSNSSSSSTVGIETPEPFDVLFGRGKPVQEHPGNILFREVLALHRDRYQAAKRGERHEIATSIVRAIRDGGPDHLPGRFLKRDDADIGYLEVPDAEACAKVSHRLRIKENQSAKTKRMNTPRGKPPPPPPPPPQPQPPHPGYWN